LHSFGLPLPRGRSRSAFTVSHRSDGFLRHQSCGFVAPRCRSWGSPRSIRSLLPLAVGSRTDTRGASPSEAFPSIAAIRHFRIPTLLSSTGQGRSDFRVFLRYPSPPQPSGVATRKRALLPWVSPCSIQPLSPLASSSDRRLAPRVSVKTTGRALPDRLLSEERRRPTSYPPLAGLLQSSVRGGHLPVRTMKLLAVTTSSPSCFFPVFSGDVVLGGVNATPRATVGANTGLAG